jgi:hypothetical protein
MDNEAAVSVYADVLVPLVDEFDVALRFWHHESQEGAARKTGSRKSAAMGARQWIDQADAHLSFVKTQDYSEEPEGEGVRTHAATTLRVEKFRGGREGQVERIDWTGYRNAAGDLERLRGALASDADTATIDAMVAACGDGPLMPSELAEAEGVKLTPKGSKFRRLTAEAEKTGRLVQDDDTHEYAVPIA